MMEQNGGHSFKHLECSGATCFFASQMLWTSSLCMASCETLAIAAMFELRTAKILDKFFAQFPRFSTNAMSPCQVYLSANNLQNHVGTPSKVIADNVT